MPNTQKKIFLDIGGMMFVTTEDTLKMREGFFRNICNDNSITNKIFIDRDGTHFRFILNYLRGSDVLPKNATHLQELFFEADFYCLEEMKTNISKKMLLSVKIQTVEESFMQLVKEIKHS